MSNPRAARPSEVRTWSLRGVPALRANSLPPCYVEEFTIARRLDMAEIFNGRYTARTDKPLVLFLIGLRLNKLLAAHKWLPVFTAMPRMLAELDRKPDGGLLSHRLYMSG